MGAVLGGRSNRDVGARSIAERILYTDYLRKQSAGLFRSHAPPDTVDCDDLLGKSFRLDGEECGR
jgi:hypothetical protein